MVDLFALDKGLIQIPKCFPLQSLLLCVIRHTTISYVVGPFSPFTLLDAANPITVIPPAKKSYSGQRIGATDL